MSQLKTHRPLVLASIMAAMFMVAIEATIVATAMPQIVGQLGGLQFYSWVFSAFLLTQTATTVVFGKLSDLFGRKAVLLAGIAVFLVGSVLCGFAWSMPSMIVFRLIQGVGAGAIQPVGMTVVGDLYSAQERGKIQGYLASVWAISAVVGPLAGGLIIQHASWAWIFWINVPLGLLAAVGFVRYLHEDIDRDHRRSIDYTGAALFTVAIASMMIALTDVSTAPWLQTSLVTALFVVSATLFIMQERRAPEPMIALDLWARRPIAAANGASLLAGMALIGLTTFLPMYVQGVMQQSPLVAGFALTMMVLGWPIGATLAARILGRFGIRRVLLAGSLLMPVGAVVFASLGPNSSPVVAGIGSLIMGFGMGLLSTTSLVLIQEIVDWSQRGSATASNIFARNLGSTLGATVFGAVLNYGLARSGSANGVSSEDLRRLLDGSAASAGLDASVRAVLEHSLHLTFLAVLVVAIVTVGFAALVPAITLARRPAPAN
ncbi:MFS transporter [Lichenihabitans sp. PAMC28606]|uniref:MDR family MFS transporter n=1 Tax=Lichenihabitans sp. PAMC28606 TaxID=2880932 RepID=UPI001D0A16DB|nr:MDR family MFS transporter [Lichenihabitans sp. PAMC28606]UDL94358.1 MFS transporter [Lichenihabitans sp. PAMC28606]